MRADDPLSFWHASPRGQATQERGLVYSQGLKEINLDRRLRVPSIWRRQPPNEAMHGTCFSCHETVEGRDLIFKITRLNTENYRMPRIQSVERAHVASDIDKQLTALLVIDPNNDFISEGGKVWDRLKGVAEANNCMPHMLDILSAACTRSGLNLLSPFRKEAI